MSQGWTDAQIGQRLIADLWEGACVNLGVGMPGLVSQMLPPEPEIILHSENGLLGFGPPPAPELCDPDLVNAGREFVTLKPGASIFHSADSFAMVRGGHVDVGVLGAYQVSERGDLANWKLPDQKLAGVGGAADICAGVKQVWIMMKHRTSKGEPRLLRECTYPLTAVGVVKRVYTDMAVIQVTPDGFRLVEAAPGCTMDEVVAATGAALQVD